MGNCSVEKTQAIYVKNTKDEIENHFVSLIKLEHFDKREPILKKQAFDDVEKIIRMSRTLISTREEQVLGTFKREINDIKENQVEMKRLTKKQITVEEYVGYTDTEQKINEYKENVEQKFDIIQRELQSNMNTTFESIKEDIESNLVNFEENDVINNEDIKANFYKWRINNREKIKQAILEVQNEFKDGLTHDYFRNKLKNVVKQDQIKDNIVRVQPKALPLTKSELALEEEDFAVSTVETTSKSWFCCMPKR